jgi:hypothetical protein
MSSISLDKIKEWFNNPENVAKMRQRILDEEKVRLAQENRIREHVKKIPQDKIDEHFLKFLDWEKRYEHFQYTHNYCCTSSTIFSRLMSLIAEESSTFLDNLDEDFLADAFTWRDYTFKLYQGQGSFWRILKNNECIFTSS